MGWLKDPRNRGRLALGLGVLLLLALALPHVVGRDARHLSAWRDGPEDVGLARAEMSSAASRVDAIVATPAALDEIDDPRGVLYVALGPERRYGDNEARAVLHFLERGGNVLLADETGWGTDVAGAAGWAFGSQRVLDTRNHQGDPELVVADARVPGDAATAYRVLLNSPSVLREIAPREHEILASSSAAAYPNGSHLDVNGNGEIDRADPAGPFPLVVRARLGEGTLVLVADTGLFMDQQLGLPEYDNADYLRALVRSLVPPDGRILVDESRHAPPPGLAPWDDALRAMGRATSGPLAPYLLLALLLGGTALAWRLTRPTEDWTHHAHDLGVEVPAPDHVKPDLARAQRMARRRISERFNKPLEQVAAMSGEDLLALTGDKLLADAAAGTLRSDPAPLFRVFQPPAPRTLDLQDVSRPDSEATP